MQNYCRVLPLAKLKMSFRISEKTSAERSEDILHCALCIVHSQFAERSEDILHSAFCILHLQKAGGEYCTRHLKHPYTSVIRRRGQERPF